MSYKACITILFTLLLIALLSFAALADTTVQFSWQPNTEPDIAGYRLYQSDTSGTYVLGAGNNIVDTPDVTATVLIPDGSWFFVLTAYDTSGNESGVSSEIMLTLPVPDMTAPSNPGGFTVIIINTPIP